MSLETSFNQQIRENFKKSIGYSSLLANPPAEKIVIVEWKKILGNLIDADGVHWKGTLEQPSLRTSGEGVLDARLESMSGMALVKLTSLPGDWKQRLDHVIWVKSLTNMGEVGSKLKQGFGDLFFIPKYSPETPRVSFLYGSFYVEVSHWEKKNVGVLAESLLKIMQDNSHPPIVGKPPAKFALTADKNKVKMGDSFSIQVKGLTAGWGAEWVYVQTEDLLPDNVALTEHEGEKFIFKALKKGTANINFTAMNTHTLLLSSEFVEVTVD